jgi:anti-sigma B factor antagonist
MAWRGGTGMQPLHVESVAAGRDRAVLRLAGEFDVYTAPQLRERVIELVDGGTRHVMADLREVTFLDSTGLGALIGGLKRLRARDGSLTLVIGTDRIRRIFRVTGLDRVFVLGPSVQEAVMADQDWQAAVMGEGDDTVEQWCRRHGLL